jgi:lauroyl/myristoyl acyltransferase
MELIIRYLLPALGMVLARGPEFVPRGLAALVGDLVWLFAKQRRRLTLGNLKHAFPDRGEAWRRQIARRSFHRLVETGLFSLASPYFTEKCIRRRFSLSSNVRELLREVHLSSRGGSVAVPHLALWETLTLTPLLAGETGMRFGAVYRPQKNPAVDKWVRESRARHGLELFSKYDGLLGPARFVRSGGYLGILTDQHAGYAGTLTLFMGRLASCTQLQGILVNRSKGEPLFAWPYRKGFWRVEVRWERLTVSEGLVEEQVLHAANRRIEDLLRSDESVCACWLWSHNRWRVEQNPQRILGYESERRLLPAAAEIPRRTAVLFVVDGTVADAREAWSTLLSEIRSGRPDFHITLCVAGKTVEDWSGLADAVFALGARPGSWALARDWRDAYFVAGFFLDAPAEAVRAAKRIRIRPRLGFVQGGGIEGITTPSKDFKPKPGEPTVDRWRRCLAGYGLRG